VPGSGAPAAAILFEAAEDGPHELSRVLAAVSTLGRQAHAQGSGQALDVFDPGFSQAICVNQHGRAGS